MLVSDPAVSAKLVSNAFGSSVGEPEVGLVLGAVSDVRFFTMIITSLLFWISPVERRNLSDEVRSGMDGVNSLACRTIQREI